MADSKESRKDKTLGQQLFPLILEGTAIGLVLYFLKVQFNFNLIPKYSDLPETGFTWSGLLLYTGCGAALFSFFGWFRYLQERS